MAADANQDRLKLSPLRILVEFEKLRGLSARPIECAVKKDLIMAKILAVNLRRVGAGLALVLLAPALSACNDDIAGSTQRPAFVRTAIVRPRVRQTSVTLTGEVQARFRADLAFRVSGRVVERLVEVGAHVDAGQVLARLDPAEQKADLDAAAATMTASESQLRVATATFERQRTLLSQRFHHPSGVRSGAGRIAKCRSFAAGREGAIGEG